MLKASDKFIAFVAIVKSLGSARPFELYKLASEAEVAAPVKSMGVPAINLKLGF